MARIFKTPFGAQGDTEQVPEAPQGDGSVSLTQGFGYDYEREYEDPEAKDIRREVMNGLFHDITEAVGDIQLSGVAKWSADAAPYPAGAVVWYNNKAWTSTSGNNNSVPDSGQWLGVALGLATPEQAQELTAGDVAITPETLGAAMNAHVLGMGQTRQNVTASRAVNTNYTNTTGRVIVVQVSSENTVLGGYLVALVEGQWAQTSQRTTNRQISAVQVVVMPGEQYRIQTVDSVILNWEEVR